MIQIQMARTFIVSLRVLRGLEFSACDLGFKTIMVLSPRGNHEGDWGHQEISHLERHSE
jgi:hypothetical protein